MDFQGGGPFRNGMLQPDYAGQHTQFVNYEYQDIIQRLSKLELSFGQQQAANEEIRNSLVGLEARIITEMKHSYQRSMEDLKKNILDLIDQKMSSNITVPNSQDEQLSTAMFSTKAESVAQRVSVSGSHEKSSIFDPLDMPPFNLASLTDNFPQMNSSNRPQAEPLMENNSGKLNFPTLPTLKSLRSRPSDGDSESRALQSSSKVAPFQSFYSLDMVIKGLRENSLFIGVLSINKKNRQEASVVVETETALMKVLIFGENARNRSLEGDHVVIKLNDESLWQNRDKMKRSLIPYKSCKRDYSFWKPKSDLLPNADADNGLFEVLESSEPVSNESFAAVTSKFYPNTAFSSNIKTNTSSSIPTGRVVAILNDDKSQGIKVRSITRRAGQDLVGSLVPRYGFDNPKLTKNEPLPKSENTVEFRPLDNRFPFLMIQREELPKQFVLNPFSFKTPTEKLVVCSIRGWFENFRFPLGRFLKVLGDSYDISAETEGLIKETGCSRNAEAFSEKILSELEKIFNSFGDSWTPPLHEVKARTDFRQESVYVISPSSVSSYQVAFHCKPSQENSNIVEVGVHVADVSYFVQENISLDIEAFNRGISVSLVNAELPMLPSKLTNSLCSLLPGEDRLSFSSIFYLTRSGEVVKSRKPSFCKSVVKVCAAITPQQVTQIVSHNVSLDEFPDLGSSRQRGSAQPSTPATDFKTFNGVSKASVADSVKLLYAVGRNRFFQRHSLSVSEDNNVSHGKSFYYPEPDVKFSLDHHGEPSQVFTKHASEVEATFEEFKILTNFYVAEQLLSTGMHFTFLLKQRPPKINEEDFFWQVLCLLGLPDPRTTPLCPESFLKLFDSIKSRQIPPLGQISDPLIGKHLSDIQKNLAGMNPMTAIAFLTFLLKDVLPESMFAIAESSSLDLNGTVDLTDAHWLVNVPYFASFTNPLHSYADITVHRLLQRSLGHRMVNKIKNTDYLEEFKEKLGVISNQCNLKVRQAKEARRRSNMLFLCALVRKRSMQKKYLESRAVVISFGQKNIKLFLVDFNITCKVNVFVDWHADFATTIYHDGTQLQYRTDVKDETKILEPTREQLEKTREKAAHRLTLKFGKDKEIELGFGVEIKVMLKPQIERKRVLGFRTDFLEFISEKK